MSHHRIRTLNYIWFQNNTTCILFLLFGKGSRNFYSFANWSSKNSDERKVNFLRPTRTFFKMMSAVVSSANIHVKRPEQTKRVIYVDIKTGEQVLVINKSHSCPGSRSSSVSSPCSTPVHSRPSSAISSQSSTGKYQQFTIQSPSGTCPLQKPKLFSISWGFREGWYPLADPRGNHTPPFSVQFLSFWSSFGKLFA